jgi:flagellar hook-associated protein 1 FlgK
VPNLLAALQAGAQALRAFDRSVSSTQNNVNNASTPGFARQEVRLEALPFDAARGLQGSVEAGALVSARNRFAEQAVRQHLQEAGAERSRSTALSELEMLFPVDIQQGILGAMTQLWSSFSAWSASPNSTQARQNVLTSASQLAETFNTVAAQLQEVASGLDRLAGDHVDRINALTGRVAELNSAQLRSPGSDPGRDANLHAALEDLASLADVTVLTANNGTVTILLEGQFPLVMGEKQSLITIDSNGPGGSARVMTEAGDVITGRLRGGELGGVLSVRNGDLAALLGEPDAPGNLDRLAKAIADRVNDLFSAGRVSEGPPPVDGRPLFVYAAADGARVAGQISVDPSLGPSDLAPIDPGPPWSANGIALRLAELSDPSSANQIDGQSFVSFFSKLAVEVGTARRSSDQRGESAEDAVAQARALRDHLSGVSLDSEAARIVQIQRGYQACARVIQVIDQLTETLVQLGQ